mmetsp:Transcript_45501/g.75334  ORF Transcript_45501/g.75334 Transcript_45501/m.75334 type:complete len:623 (-) Transcript_45501:171-2039(-)
MRTKKRDALTVEPGSEHLVCDRIVLTGLAHRRAHLNGHNCVLKSWDPIQKRWKVKVKGVRKCLRLTAKHLVGVGPTDSGLQAIPTPQAHKLAEPPQKCSAKTGAEQHCDANGGFAEHRNFAASFCDASDSDALMYHLRRLEQAYSSRLPADLAAESSLSFNLGGGRCAALERLANLFNAQWRMRHLNPETAKAVSRALAGPNPQGACWKGWRLSGFGETQVSGPRAAVVHGPAIIAAFRKMWGTAVVCEGVPRTILRPPGGSALAGHIDSGSLLEMHLACQHQLAVGKSSPIDWAREHGCQALVHWEGARPSSVASKDGAHTCGLSGLSTSRYLVLLSMVHPNYVHAAVPPPKALDARAASLASKKGQGGFDPHGIAIDSTAELADLLPRASDPVVARFIVKGGPVFAPFFDAPVLAALNEALRFLEQGDVPRGATALWIDALRSAGKLELLQAECAKQHSLNPLGPVVFAPMCPQSSAPETTHAPICISWLRGWPHMVKPGGVRLTFVPGLQPQPKAAYTLKHYEAERKRSFGRTLLMVRGEYTQIRAHPEFKKPIAGGAVHSHPEQEEQMHRDYDTRAYATLSELLTYERITSEMNAAALVANCSEHEKPLRRDKRRRKK